MPDTTTTPTWALNVAAEIVNAMMDSGHMVSVPHPWSVQVLAGHIAEKCVSLQMFEALMEEYRASVDEKE